jgi:LPXTG-site transpeptidase (sortase) family protein
MHLKRILFGAESMRGLARAHLLAGLGGAVVLVAAAGGGYFALSGGGSEEEEPVVQATGTPTSSPVPTAETPAQPPLQESHRMIIEKIGVDAPVATYGMDAQNYPVVPTGPDANKVVAWYNFSQRPGQHGNSVYAGHVTWNGDAVFRNLDKVGEGDLIKLRDDRGAEAVYSITDKHLVDANDPNAVQAILPTGDDVLTIVTCGGDYFETNDPVFGGDYTHRVIVRAKLVSVTPAAA